MNSRARNRLIGVTAIIVIIIAVVFATQISQGGGPAVYKTTTEIANNQQKYAGSNITVGGPVIQGSWDKKTHPMTFSIGDEKNPKSKATLKVVFNGAVPSTFGDGVVAIVTGKLDTNGTVQATDMQTKCPEKEDKKTAALSIDNLMKNEAQLKGVYIKVTGALTPGSLVPPGGDVRFSIETTAGTKLKVHYDGAPPAGFNDGVAVVVGGSLDPSSGVFTATSVAIGK